jgi:hypothetical protein
VGANEPSAHGLLPLFLGVIMVQEKLARTGAQVSPVSLSDPNSVAAFIAAAVALYEYAEDPATPPWIMDRDPRAGRFLNDGRELHFFDGTPARRRLAVQADELAAVIAKLTQAPREASSR